MGQLSKATLASLPLRYLASFGILRSARETSTWRSKALASLPRIFTILVECIEDLCQRGLSVGTGRVQGPAEASGDARRLPDWGCPPPEW
eukprot:1612345-Pyramimonas_sp.AAC.1